MANEKKTINQINIIQDEKIKRSLNTSIKEGALNAASSSIFSTFLVPLALALKATNLQVGFISTAQELATMAGQIPGAKLTAYFDRKNIWLISQIIGKIALWIPIILLPFMNLHDPVTYLMIFAAMSAFFLALRGPAWSSLMGDLVKQENRGRYFGKRNMTVGAAGVLTTLVAGFIVGSFGFAVIFSIGIILTIISIPIF